MSSHLSSLTNQKKYLKRKLAGGQQINSGRQLTPEEIEKINARVLEIEQLLLAKPTNEHISEVGDSVVEQLSELVKEQFKAYREEQAAARPQKKARVGKPARTKEQIEPLLKKAKEQFLKHDNEKVTVVEYRDMIAHIEGMDLSSFSPQAMRCLPLKGNVPKLKELADKAQLKVESVKYKNKHAKLLKDIKQLEDELEQMET